MKIVLNVEKKHLIFFGLFLILAGSIFVIANPQYPAKVGHVELQTDTIYPFSQEGMINIPGNLRIGNNNDGSSWRVGINGNTIMNGNLRVEKNLCDKNNRCISVEDLIDKMKGLGVGSGVGDNSIEVLNAYGDDMNMGDSWNCNARNDNTKQTTISNGDLSGKEVMIIEATGRVSNENHHIGISFKLKNKNTGEIISTLSPYQEANNLRYGDNVETDNGEPYITSNNECDKDGDWCTRTQRVEIDNNFKTRLDNSDLLVEFIACGIHEDKGNQNKIIGEFKKEGLIVTGF